MEKESIFKSKNFSFLAVLLSIIISILGIHIGTIIAARSFDERLVDLKAAVPFIREPMLLNLFISLGLILFSFGICSLLKSNKLEKIRIIATSFFCFLLIIPGGIITEAFESGVAYLLKNHFFGGTYYSELSIQLSSKILWINLTAVTSIKFAGISLILLGCLKRVKKVITLADILRCSLIVGLANFAMLSRVAVNMDMWPGISSYLGFGFAMSSFKQFDSILFPPDNALEIWGIIIEMSLALLVTYFIYLLTKKYRDIDPIEKEVVIAKNRIIRYRLTGGCIGLFIVTLPYWIFGYKLVNETHIKFTIKEFKESLLFGIQSGVLTGIIGTLFVMIILITAQRFSNKWVAVGLILMVGLLSIYPNNLFISRIVGQYKLLKSPLGVGLICGLNPLSLIGLLYFICTKSISVKLERNNYIRIVLAVYLTKFVSGFIAYGQVLVISKCRNYQPMAFFYNMFGQIRATDMFISGCSDPLSAGIMATIIGILIVFAMVCTTGLLEDEDASNSLWLGVLHK